ncbi:hypothetical protein CXF68_09180 [Tenacibaculum sp. Bg11-29]|uniref:hypothetical protein n=1 Tax=Tenacibaculum sp. Bg11-29 TaxID=2058306 RepID=UPI000C339D28|nr:hypothetical protein [Tenacibaculum sp. Bg11-29]PKH50848.1 hypothetical protein CXF68_09180 [Tenacibaculum sp. Bg11-29]
MKKDCKSVFVISVSHRKVTPIENPEPNKPKFNVENHDYSILVIDKTIELVKLLSAYTDFQEWTNEDFLAQKQNFKEHSSMQYPLNDVEKFRNEILADNDKPHSWDLDYWWRYYDEHSIGVRRLPVGIIRDPFNQNLFTH